MNLLNKNFFILITALLLSSCEEEITIDLPESGGKMVLEGKIEKGMPPIIYLTETISFFSSISVEKIQSAYIHNANITISNGDTTVKLKEYRSDSIQFFLNTLPPIFKLIYGNMLPEFLLKNNDTLPSGTSFFVYYFYTLDFNNINLSSIFLGEDGKNYSLTIKEGNRTLTGVTSIPVIKNLDSLWFEKTDNPLNDTNVILWTQLTDSVLPGNNYRYFTRRNREPFFPNPYGSVFDDHLINGKSLTFSVDRGRNRNVENEPGTGRTFNIGDTVTVKWCAIDRDHYLFWRSLEADRRSVGNPFGSPTIIESNVEGGLGVWGGYGVVYQTIIAK
ncbi:MAG: hypothetical protein A3H98_14665 [Bacteroidetes bacterium RIFCSPLOWO2_02_FULL_36_8]|nr:MAG: hypothetical protein A3H98_14665 [Bacteroidetes bacterium RIFCSPLOWO2_02_FULL_36_8]